jgi:acyl carrier protein
VFISLYSFNKIIEPKTSTEKAIIKIMEDTFKLHIGINNSFISIGGNSLLAMQIVSKIEDVLSVKIPAYSLLSDPTIAETARRIDLQLAQNKINNCGVDN